MKESMGKSELHRHFTEKFLDGPERQPIMMNALRAPCIAEKALIYLFAEENLITLGQMKEIANELSLDMQYINDRLLENKRLEIR